MDGVPRLDAPRPQRESQPRRRPRRSTDPRTGRVGGRAVRDLDVVLGRVPIGDGDRCPAKRHRGAVDTRVLVGHGRRRRIVGESDVALVLVVAGDALVTQRVCRAHAEVILGSRIDAGGRSRVRSGKRQSRAEAAQFVGGRGSPVDPRGRVFVRTPREDRRGRTAGRVNHVVGYDRGDPIVLGANERKDATFSIDETREARREGRADTVRVGVLGRGRVRVRVVAVAAPDASACRSLVGRHHAMPCRRVRACSQLLEDAHARG